MERMRITGLQTFLVNAHWRNWTIVRLDTDSGLSGYGEGTLEGREQSVETAIRELERYLVGKDPFQIERHFQEMYRRAFWTGGGRAQQRHQRSGHGTLGHQGQGPGCSGLRAPGWPGA